MSRIVNGASSNRAARSHGLAGYNVGDDGQLARSESDDQRDADDRDRQLLRSARRADGDGPGVHDDRGAARTAIPTIVVISHGFWQQRLAADPAVIGSSVTINGRPYTVVGVLPASYRSVTGFGLAPEVYLPLSRAVDPDLDERHGGLLQLLGRLGEGDAASDARARLSVVAQRLAPLYDDKSFGDGHAVRPTRIVRQRWRRQSHRCLFRGAPHCCSLILAIACANVAGLLLSRGHRPPAGDRDSRRARREPRPARAATLDGRFLDRLVRHRRRPAVDDLSHRSRRWLTAATADPCRAPRPCGYQAARLRHRCSP